MTTGPLLTTTDATATDADGTATATLRVQIRLADGWFTVCALDRLDLPGRGTAALLPDGRQAALFQDRSGTVYAVDNRDPFTGAHVLARGLTGSHQGRVFVASPLLKQRFDLVSGRCLDDEEVAVQAYETRVVAG